MTSQFRSLIKRYFPPDMLAKLEIIANDRKISNNEKTKDIIDLLNDYNVPFTPLGNGTNRYGILIDGYAVKIALDRAGQIDNMREFKYAKEFGTDVVKVYECTPNKGTIAVFEYITVFSMTDMHENTERMREILGRITQSFLIGDMGVSPINFINWGTRLDNSIAILDFAYIYSLSYKGFQCTCEDEGSLQYDRDFNYLICPYCRKKYEFADIRKRITKEDEIAEIGDIRNDGYVLTEPVQTIEINFKESEWAKPKEKKKKVKPVKENLLETDCISEDAQLRARNALNTLLKEAQNNAKENQQRKADIRRASQKPANPQRSHQTGRRPSPQATGRS